MTTALALAGFALRFLAAAICIAAIMLTLRFLAEFAIGTGWVTDVAAYFVAGYIAYPPVTAIVRLARIA